MQTLLFNLRNPERVYHSLIGNRHGGKIDKEITFVYKIFVACDLVDIGYRIIRAYKFIIVERFNTPKQIQLGKDSSIGSKY